MIRIETKDEKIANTNYKGTVRYICGNNILEFKGYPINSCTLEQPIELFLDNLVYVKELLDYYLLHEKGYRKLKVVDEIFDSIKFYLPLFDYFWVEQVLEVKDHVTKDGSYYHHDLELEIKRLTAELKVFRQNIGEILSMLISKPVTCTI